MKRAILLSCLALAACAEVSQGVEKFTPELRILSPQGAGTGPYSIAEYRVRADDRQPGLFQVQEPWTLRQARLRKNIEDGLTETALASNSQEKIDTIGTAVDLARQGPAQSTVSYGREELALTRVRVDGIDFAVLLPTDGRWSQADKAFIDSSLESAALGQTSCGDVIEAFGYESNEGLSDAVVYQLSCS